MNIINLTPHPLVVIGGSATVTIPPSGTVARVATHTEPAGYVDVDGITVPVQKQVLGQIVNLPDPAPDTIYVVSLPVAAAAGRLGRTDVVSPRVVRDEQGNVVGCDGFLLSA